MALFDLELSEGLNAVSIPLIMDEEASKWSNILQGIAFNSIRTITDGDWQDFIRGRPSDLNDFDSVDFKKGYLIDIIRVSTLPIISFLVPATTELAQIDYNDSVYSDDIIPLLSIPLKHTAALWIRTDSTDTTNTDASYITFDVDRAINLYVCYESSATSIPSWLENWDDTGDTVQAGTEEYAVYRLPVAAGTITLPGNRNGGGNANSMYLVFMEENAFPITVTSPADHQITILDEGKTYYLDRLYIVTDLPEEVENMSWVRLRNDHFNSTSNNYFEMELEDEGYVYVAYPEDTCPVPAWLEAFDTLNKIIQTNSINLRLYRKWSSAGPVVLGGASALTLQGTNANPPANYIVGAKRVGAITTTIMLEGDEPSGIVDLPIAGTDKGGLSLIGVTKSNVADLSIENNINIRGLQYSTLSRLRRGIWDSYIPMRHEILNWAPADLQRGLGYFIRSSIPEDQILEIDYDS